MNSRTLFFAMAIALAPGMATAGSVYKWTDDEGVTHFGDRQPPGRQAESVNIRTGSSSGGQQRNSPQERLEQLQGQQAEQAEQKKLSAAEEARQKQRKANCETAQQNLNILKTYSRVRVEEDGEQRYLSPEEIEERRQQFQEVADENCGEEQPQK